LLAELEFSSRKRWQRFFHFRESSEGDHATAPVGEFSNVIASLGLLQFFQKLSREAPLHGGQGAAPLLGNKEDSAMLR